MQSDRILLIHFPHPSKKTAAAEPYDGFETLSLSPEVDWIIQQTLFWH